jgi:hypothetical protein
VEILGPDSVYHFCGDKIQIKRSDKQIKNVVLGTEITEERQNSRKVFSICSSEYNLDHLPRGGVWLTDSKGTRKIR